MPVRIYRKSIPIQALLEKGPKAVLGRLTLEVQRQRDWRAWLEERLPPELTGRLTGVVEKDSRLVVFTESAVWSARIRYAMKDLEQAVREDRPSIAHIEVRVMPRR